MDFIDVVLEDPEQYGVADDPLEIWESEPRRSVRLPAGLRRDCRPIDPSTVDGQPPAVNRR